MVKVYASDATPEQLKEWEEEEEGKAMDQIALMASIAPRGSEFECGLGRLAEFQSMFPREQALAEDGDWILVKGMAEHRIHSSAAVHLVCDTLAGNDEGIPKDKLFYLRSRGIPKRDAIVMLLKEIRSPAACWIETRKEIASAFVRTWPDERRLATVNTTSPSSD